MTTPPPDESFASRFERLADEGVFDRHREGASAPTAPPARVGHKSLLEMRRTAEDQADAEIARLWQGPPKDLRPAVPIFTRIRARRFDMVLWGSVCIATSVFGIYGDPTLMMIVMLGVWLLWIPLEAAFIHHFGFTPGKRLCDLRVETSSGENLPFMLSLRRAALVQLRGFALMIPPFLYFAAARTLRRMHDEGSTTWDDDLGTRVVMGA